MQILGDQHCLRPEELRIHGDDESKRLSQDALEQHWVRWSEGATTNIPVWAKEDTVLQQIISQDACQSVPLSLAPSLMHGEFASSTSSSASVLKGQSDMSTKLLPTDRAPHPLSDRETPASQACSYALLHGRRMSRLFPSELNKVYKHRSKIITTRSKAPRVAKASWKPSMGLRSRKMSTFYELGWARRQKGRAGPVANKTTVRLAFSILIVSGFKLWKPSADGLIVPTQSLSHVTRVEGGPYCQLDTFPKEKNLETSVNRDPLYTSRQERDALLSLWPLAVPLHDHFYGLCARSWCIRCNVLGRWRIGARIRFTCCLRSLTGMKSRSKSGKASVKSCYTTSKTISL